MSGARYKSTRAITIDAPPEAVWPWLVQVGCLRGGWYSNDLLDNLAHPNATTVLPELQHLEIGQWVPMSPTPTEHNGTRLVARINARYDWRHPPSAVLGVLLMEFGDFAMLRRMLRGIKARAESLDQNPSQTSGGLRQLTPAPLESGTRLTSHVQP